MVDTRIIVENTHSSFTVKFLAIVKLRSSASVRVMTSNVIYHHFGTALPENVNAALTFCFSSVRSTKQPQQWTLITPNVDSKFTISCVFHDCICQQIHLQCTTTIKRTNTRKYSTVLMYMMTDWDIKNKTESMLGGGGMKNNIKY